MKKTGQVLQYTALALCLLLAGALLEQQRRKRVGPPEFSTVMYAVHEASGVGQYNPLKALHYLDVVLMFDLTADQWCHAMNAKTFALEMLHLTAELQQACVAMQRCEKRSKTCNQFP